MFVFRAECEESAPTIRLKGLEPDAKYELTFADGYGEPDTVSGRDLMERGVRVDLPTFNSSELVYLSKKND